MQHAHLIHRNRYCQQHKYSRCGPSCTNAGDTAELWAVQCAMVAESCREHTDELQGVVVLLELPQRVRHRRQYKGD